MYDPEEIIIKCRFVINIGNRCAAFFIFSGTPDTFLGSLINEKSKEQHLFKIEMFSNNINL